MKFIFKCLKKYDIYKKFDSNMQICKKMLFFYEFKLNKLNFFSVRDLVVIDVVATGLDSDLVVVLACLVFETASAFVRDFLAGLATCLFSVFFETALCLEDGFGFDATFLDVFVSSSSSVSGKSNISS
jgi:hypothetical protein